MKNKKLWGGQGNGRGGYYPKKELKQNLPWRQQSKGFPYKEDPLTDEEYLKDRTELFRKSGNGWWWQEGTREQRKKRR
mgnify:CR=1 FL=1